MTAVTISITITASTTTWKIKGIATIAVATLKCSWQGRDNKDKNLMVLPSYLLQFCSKYDQYQHLAAR